MLFDGIRQCQLFVHRSQFHGPGLRGNGGQHIDRQRHDRLFRQQDHRADTVDKGIVTQTDGAQKQVFLATATTLSFGQQPGDGGTLDADGYPTTLDVNPLVRQ